MKIEVDRKDLEALVMGSSLYYSEFSNPLAIKAGHDYSDQYGRTSWRNIDKLSESELYELYKICKNSWK